MVVLHDVEFARTLNLDFAHGSVFIWNDSGFAVELPEAIFLQAVAREVRRVPSEIVRPEVLAA